MTMGSEDFAGDLLSTTTSDEIYAWLRDQVVDGHLTVGDRIPSEMELCERWQTSRGTVRQALERLILLGIISKVQGSGSFVSDASNRLLQDPLLLSILFKEHDLQELLLFQRTLAVGAARLCAENRNEEALNELTALLAVMEDQTSDPRFAETDLAFHMTIARSSGNAIHLRFYQMLQQVLSRQVKANYPVLNADVSLEDNRRILSAIKEQDAFLAGYLMENRQNRLLHELNNDRNEPSHETGRNGT